MSIAVFTNQSDHRHLSPWAVPPCAHCACSIVKVVRGGWSHVVDFAVRDVDHMPIPAPLTGVPQ